MNIKTLTISVLILGFIFTASGFQHGRNLVGSDVSSDAAECGLCVYTDDDDNIYCTRTDTTPVTKTCCTKALIEADTDDECQESTATCQSVATTTFDSKVKAYEDCPASTNCGSTTSVDMEKGDSAETFEPDADLAEGEYCLYELEFTAVTSTDDSLSVQFEAEELANAEIVIYSKAKTGGAYTEVTTLAKGETKTAKINTDDHASYHALVVATAAAGAATINAEIVDTPADSGNIVGPAVYSLLLVLALMQIF